MHRFQSAEHGFGKPVDKKQKGGSTKNQTDGTAPIEETKNGSKLDITAADSAVGEAGSKKQNTAAGDKAGGVPEYDPAPGKRFCCPHQRYGCQNPGEEVQQSTVSYLVILCIVKSKQCQKNQGSITIEQEKIIHACCTNRQTYCPGSVRYRLNS